MYVLFFGCVHCSGSDISRKAIISIVAMFFVSESEGKKYYMLLVLLRNEFRKWSGVAFITLVISQVS